MGFRGGGGFGEGGGGSGAFGFSRSCGGLFRGFASGGGSLGFGDGDASKAQRIGDDAQRGRVRKWPRERRRDRESRQIILTFGDFLRQLILQSGDGFLQSLDSLTVASLTSVHSAFGLQLSRPESLRLRLGLLPVQRRAVNFTIYINDKKNLEMKRKEKKYGVIVS